MWRNQGGGLPPGTSTTTIITTTTITISITTTGMLLLVVIQDTTDEHSFFNTRKTFAITLHPPTTHLKQTKWLLSKESQNMEGHLLVWETGNFQFKAFSDL
ncbi:uncharacterized protein LOC119980825 [Tripterygium wilfordii]|uniref:uncharacterized protein LOC119980825 n=1 Tax=Tripterygium wilfordii TaxID=458696 RepID=UPI0018F81312|nr:uncharacterized protein LOC119980825 [Tripterygium wilfordii]